MITQQAPKMSSSDRVAHPVGSGEVPSAELIARFCDAHRLTPRERQILAMVCKGLKNSQIGRELSVSNATIRLHIGNIHRKLDTGSKVDLVLRLWQWSCSPKPGASRPLSSDWDAAASES